MSCSSRMEAWPRRDRPGSWLVGALGVVMVAGGAAQPPLPDRGAVGPAAMPPAIAPVAPPFEMPQPRRPAFPDRVIDIDRQRVAEDGSITAAVQAAIDELAAAGGGTVVIPPGTWRSGRIILRSGVNLHVATGATVRFSGAIDDYLPVVRTWYEGVEVMSPGGLIYACGEAGVAVTGGGVLEGPSDGPLREVRPGLVEQLVDPASPVPTRVFDGRDGRHFFRPNFLVFVDCRDVLVEGVTLRHGPMWHVSPIACEGVVIRGVAIESRGVGNGDGVDVVASRNVLVEYCSADTGDDSYALKAGRSAALTPAGAETANVVLRHNLATGGTGGIACGSETAGGIRNVHVHDCVLENVRHAIYLKTRRPRSGGGEHWLIERVAFSCSHTAVMVDMLGSRAYAGPLADRLPAPPDSPQTPFYRDITIRRLVGTSGGEALKVKGLPERPVEGFMLDGCDLRGPRLISLADVAGLTVRDSLFLADDPVVMLLDAAGVSFDGCRFGLDGRLPKIERLGASAIPRGLEPGDAAGMTGRPR